MEEQLRLRLPGAPGAPPGAPAERETAHQAPPGAPPGAHGEETAPPELAKARIRRKKTPTCVYVPVPTGTPGGGFHLARSLRR